MLAFAGGKAALQSSMGWHVLEPRSAMVAPVHGAAGASAWKPHGSATNPCGTATVPTGAHVAVPEVGRLPAGQARSGATPPPPGPASGAPSGSDPHAASATATAATTSGKKRRLDTAALL